MSADGVAPLEVDTYPAQYWTAVFELTAMAGELARPAKLAQRIVAGQEAVESLATEG